MDLQLKAVLFDLYGTLLDVSINEDGDSFWRQLAEELGRYGKDWHYRELRERFGHLQRSIASEFGEGFVMKELFRQILSTSGPPASDIVVSQFADRFRALSIESLRVRTYAKPLLRLLKRNRYAAGLVSNTEAVLTRYDLRVSGIGRYFDAIVLSSDAGYKKPDPQIFERALHLLRLRPSEALFIGDDWGADVEGAIQVGMRAVYVNTSRPPARATPSAIVARPTFSSLLAALRTVGVASFDRD